MCGRTVTVTVAAFELVVPPLVTARENVQILPASDAGAVNCGDGTFAFGRNTTAGPDVCVHAYPVGLPDDAPADRITVSRLSTVTGTPAFAVTDVSETTSTRNTRTVTAPDVTTSARNTCTAGGGPVVTAARATLAFATAQAAVAVNRN